MVTEEPPECDGDQSLTIGLLLNRDSANSIIDKGPAADSSEVMVIFTPNYSSLRTDIELSIVVILFYLEFSIFFLGARVQGFLERQI